MRQIACATALSCLIVALVATALWQYHMRRAVSPRVYSSLFVLQRMAPRFFAEHVRERLDVALEDGKLSYKELYTIEKALPPMAPVLREALRAHEQPGPDPLAPVQEQPQSPKPNKPGLGERFGSALDSLFHSLQRKYYDFSGNPPQAEPPTEL